MWTTTVISGEVRKGQRRKIERVKGRTQRHKATAAPKKCWGTHIDVVRKQEEYSENPARTQRVPSEIPSECSDKALNTIGVGL